MKLKYSLLLLAAALCAACESDPAPTPGNYTLDLSSDQLVLSGMAGATGTLTVNASVPWTAETAGAGYTFTPASGGAGETTITLTADVSNDTRQHAELGALIIRSGAGSAPHAIPVVQAPVQAAQTLLMYLSGMGNLVGGFSRNIANALKAVDAHLPGEGRVLVFQQITASKAQISELYYLPSAGCSAQTVLKTYNETLSSTDSETLTRILKDMLALAPADQYGLVMGSHATGWVPSTYTVLRAAGVSDLYWQKTEGVPQTRGFGYDKGTTMDIPVLAASIEAVKADFQYLIFDACFMSSVEALYDLRNAARRIIASPCEIMLYGFPYDLTLPCLFTDEGRSHDLTAACESFHQFYTTTTLTEKSGCIALTECAELDALAAIMRRIHERELQAYDPETLQIYEGLAPHLFYDLGDFVTAACPDAGLLEEFNTQFDRTFPPTCRLHTPTFYTAYQGIHIPVESYSGVSVSEPSTKYTPENQATAWYKATHP